MTLEQWRKQKEADRVAGDRAFRADPANARRYLVNWGLRPGDKVHWEDCQPLNEPAAHNATSSDRPAHGR